MSAALMEEDEDEEASSAPASAAPASAPASAGGRPAPGSAPVLPYFGGYSSVVREAWGLMLRGLELDLPAGGAGAGGAGGRAAGSAVSGAVSRPPRGLLVYGSRGTGKSTLMRKLVEAANVAVEEISHSIVLSRYVLYVYIYS
jgi:Cdc6-like AAA superfamily ATPase